MLKYEKRGVRDLRNVRLESEPLLKDSAATFLLKLFAPRPNQQPPGGGLTLDRQELLIVWPIFLNCFKKKHFWNKVQWIHTICIKVDENAKGQWWWNLCDEICREFSNLRFACLAVDGERGHPPLIFHSKVWAVMIMNRFQILHCFPQDLHIPDLFFSFWV